MERRELLESGLPEDEVFARVAYHSRAGGVHERALAFYLLEVDRRRLYQSRGFTTTSAYAERAVGLGERATRELLRVGRLLEGMPGIDRAFARAQICWSKVREIVRVATPGTEEAWLEFARGKTTRQVQQAVAGARRGDPPSEGGAGPRPATFQLRARLPAHVHEKLQRAIARIRALAGGRLSLAEALGVLAEMGLSLEPDGTVPGWQPCREAHEVVVYHRDPRSGEAWIDTDLGPASVPPQVLEDAEREGPAFEATPPRDPGGGAPILFGRSGRVPKEERDPPVSAVVRAVVRARDGGRCVVCGRRHDLEVHHLRPRADGGKSEIDNLVCVCRRCHALVHSGLLVLRVDGRGRVQALDREGRPLPHSGDPSAESALYPGDLPVHTIEREGADPAARAAAGTRGPAAEVLEEAGGAGSLPPAGQYLASIEQVPGRLTVREWRRIRELLDWSASRRGFLFRPGTLPDPVDPPAGASAPAGPAHPERPRTLSDYVGQEAVVSNLATRARIAKREGRALGHVLLAGPPGLGKTTLLRLLAAELGVGFHETCGQAVETPAQLLGLLAELGPRDILFVDEMHRLGAACQALLLSAMEDGRLEAVLVQGARAREVTIELEPFTLVGATTAPAALSKPLRDRFATVATLGRYSLRDLRAILEGAAARAGGAIAPAAAEAIARRARETPREAVRLLGHAAELARSEGAERIERVHALRAAQSDGIDENGLNPVDRAILGLLMAVGRPVGLRTIADSLELDEETVRSLHEPYLLRRGFLERTWNGRVATEKAWARYGLGRRRALVSRG